MQIIIISESVPLYQYVCTLSRLGVAFWRYFEEGGIEVEVCYA